MLFLTFVHNHFYIAKKKWKINGCAKIISGTKVNVIYSVMYAIRNFLNGNDNWYNFKKITYIFTPFLQILWHVKKTPGYIHIFYHLLVGYMYRKFKAKRSEICMLLYRYSSVLFTRCICMQFGWGVQCKSSYCVSSSDISLVIYKTCKLLHHGYHQSYCIQ